MTSTTEQQQKAEILALLDKMLSASNVRGEKKVAGMGSVNWSLAVVDRFGRYGPSLLIQGQHGTTLSLTPNGPSVELTTDEAATVKDAIEGREDPVTTIKHVESLLHV